MSRRYLVIGDLHVKRDNLLDITDLHQRIMSHLSSVDEVIILGDTLDRHEVIHMKPLCLSSRMIKSYAEKVPVRVLIGNHDRENNTVYCTDESPFIQWSLCPPPNITIVDRPIQIGNCLLVPYVPPGRFMEAIKGFDLSTIRVIFAHQEFAGCVYNQITSEVKETWNSPIQIISGHIHDTQQIGNVLYTGTPLQNAFNESPNKYIFTVDVGETVQFTPIPIVSVQKLTMKFNLPLPPDILSQIGYNKCKITITDSVANIETFKVSELYAILKSMQNVKVILEPKQERQRYHPTATIFDVIKSKLTSEELSLLTTLMQK